MSELPQDWQFLDPPNTAVFTTANVLDGIDWIHRVTHDEEDGTWQFHSLGGPPRVSDAMLVSLRSIVKLDPSVEELADLPLGWQAWRETKDAQWKRSPLGS